jgi:hypothetical protein
MKMALILIAVLLVALLGLALWERWDERKNRGFTWGYWGEFNTVSNCLTKLPGVTVVKAWCNADFLVLEEYGFDIIAQGQQVSLAFGEKDPIRRLSGQPLEKALLEQIRKQLSNKRMEPMTSSAIRRVLQPSIGCALLVTAHPRRSA